MHCYGFLERRKNTWFILKVHIWVMNSKEIKTDITHTVISSCVVPKRDPQRVFIDRNHLARVYRVLKKWLKLLKISKICVKNCSPFQPYKVPNRSVKIKTELLCKGMGESAYFSTVYSLIYFKKLSSTFTNSYRHIFNKIIYKV